MSVAGADETEDREVSADTMRLLLLNPSWRGRRRACPGNEAEPDCGPDRATEKQAGLGEGYEGDSPRLGMIQSMETLGVQLLGGYAAERER